MTDITRRVFCSISASEYVVGVRPVKLRVYSAIGAPATVGSSPKRQTALVHTVSEPNSLYLSMVVLYVDGQRNPHSSRVAASHHVTARGHRSIVDLTVEYVEYF